MYRWLPALLIIALLMGFRVAGSVFPEKFPNVQPLLAVLLCSLVFLKGVSRWLIPLLVWIITDPITSLMQGYPVLGAHHLSIALGVMATVAIALFARRNPSPGNVLLSTAASALAFFFVTNLFSFAVDPQYSKTLEGFLQSQWTGKGAIPTWVFLRNLLAGNLIFTALFLIARRSVPREEGKSASAIVCPD